HSFTLPGLRLDSRAVKLVLSLKRGDATVAVELQADRDVRQWTASAALLGEQETCTVARIGDPLLQQLLDASSARRPIVVEVPETHDYWVKAAGAHSVVGGRRAASRPVFLVREGVLPAPVEPVAAEAWSATWSVAAPEVAEVTQNNVMAVLRGSELKDQYVVVSAHYDHIGTGPAKDGDTIRNGADDDASGTTAVVLLADAMAKLPPPKRSVLFVCFAGEELRLRGSAAFCDKPPVPLEQIVANVNIEMIGRPEPGNEGKAWITGDDLSDFAKITEAALERAGVGLVEFQMASRLFTQSDNFSFVRHGIVAHSLSAGSLHADYHQPGDEVSKLDIPHMTKIVRGLFEAVREFAQRDAVPAWNEKGKERLGKLKK
ncbi:MAG: M28 family peptidase, partial [Planctomycetota bacterium]